MRIRSLFLLALLPATLSACDGETSTDDKGGEEADADTDADTDADPTVYDVRTGVYAENTEVELPNLVVTSPDAGYGFFVQDQSGSEYAGIWVYYGSVTALAETGAGVSIGDEVTLAGEYYEYSDLSEIEILDAAGITITGTASVPSAIALTDTDWGDTATLEKYESMLVSVSNVTASEDIDYGEWLWDTNIVTDDVFFDAGDDLPVVVGSTADGIVGNLNYSYSAFKMEPHDATSFTNFAAPPCPADLCPEDLSAGDLVVTEIMYDPSYGSDSTHEWFEIYNATSSSIELQGLTIEDDGGNSNTISDSVIVASGDYVVMGASDGSSWTYSFTPEYFYGSIAFGNSSGDHVYLYYSGSSTSTDIDTTANYSGVGASAGYSVQLDPTLLDATSNDSDTNWCQASTEIGSTGDYGTPGAANDSCL